ncbi:hypothetical protein [Actinoallomurus sp. NPDC052274]|uniref:helix-turn-helix transcriptional regulator n=1 Tax=Actinoallomurus sp. NPDC052274 TaxID=3155420 RepID=UPI00343CC105
MENQPDRPAGEPQSPVRADWRVTVTLAGYLDAEDATKIDHTIDSSVTVIEQRPASERADVTVAVDAAGLVAAVHAGLAAVARGLADAGLKLHVVGVQARTAEEYERERAEPSDLVNAAEISKILGISRQRVHQLVERPDFPKWRYNPPTGKLYDRHDIEEFDRHWDRTIGRPRKTSRSE